MKRRAFLEQLSALYSLVICFGVVGCEPQEDISQPAKGVSLGKVINFPQGVTEVAMFRVAVIRYGSEIRVVSLVCPHQSCVVKSLVGGGYQCPCHGSEFDAKGVPQSGPAQKPMTWVAAEVTDGGELLIFPRQPVAPDFSIKL